VELLYIHVEVWGGLELRMERGKRSWRKGAKGRLIGRSVILD
jgi:hypothetical protein